jgi:hypothetical protein
MKEAAKGYGGGEESEAGKSDQSPPKKKPDIHFLGRKEGRSDCVSHQRKQRWVFLLKKASKRLLNSSSKNHSLFSNE